MAIIPVAFLAIHVCIFRSLLYSFSALVGTLPDGLVCLGLWFLRLWGLWCRVHLEGGRNALAFKFLTVPDAAWAIIPVTDRLDALCERWLAICGVGITDL